MVNSWAGFNIIEVMSSPKFTEKRAGYLAACQSFHKDTEVLMLTTNMIRKDLSSQNTYDAGVALSSLACFLSPDLARDLSGDIMSLLSSTRPYIRKKAVLILYKVIYRDNKLLPPFIFEPFSIDFFLSLTCIKYPRSSCAIQMLSGLLSLG